MNSKKNAIIVFVDYPENGKILTKIAEETNEYRAQQIYLDLLFHTNRIVEFAYELGNEIYIYCNPSDRILETQKFFDKKYIFKAQIGNRLSNRIYNAFNEVFSYNHQNIVLISVKCPFLKISHIKKTFENLENHDIVVGPINNDGFYLIGLKNEPQIELFENIELKTNLINELEKKYRKSWFKIL